MKNLIYTLLFSGLLFWGMNSALTDMTIADCNAGIQAACLSIK